ncbi:MAG: DegT/DnrJ/EryC1/StrS family aminotransferase [Lachnospiraceae bacterium]|nr:DegT/DnrJ/EryC1/StrS family aminotransferase [Lachnospiraceae bacterium]
MRWFQYQIRKWSIDLSDTIPFSPPDISDLEIQEVSDALRSGWITTGPRTKLLEKNLKEYLEASGCVCLNSNTACLEMALRILGIGDGDEVITCAYTYTASASPVIHVGAKLVLVDCGREDGSIEMDYDALEKAITTRTKAVIPVDLAGIPCDYDRVFEIVERKKALFSANSDIQAAIGRVVVIADAAHALGARYKGGMVGSVADFSCFSFHAVKNFTTGEGGALTWRHIDGVDDDQIYKQLQLYSLHGQSKDALAKTQKGSWEYDIVAPWYKCNMTDVAAAIGLAQLERYPLMLRRRRIIIRKYDDALKQRGIITLEHRTEDRTGSGHLYITRVPGITEEVRNKIIIEMAEAGVTCNVHYKPLPMMTAYKNLGFDIADYPNAYDKYVNEITLPLYSTLSDSEVAKTIDKFTEICNGYIKSLN